MPRDLVPVGVGYADTQPFEGDPLDIIHPPALAAADVMVFPGVTVEAGLSPAVFELADDSGSGQQLQIAIHGSEADPGQTAPDPFVELGGGRMVPVPAQLFENDLTLGGVPLTGFS
jgi:hypothetical protein